MQRLSVDCRISRASAARQAKRDRIGNPERATAPRTSASTRLLRVFRCVPGRYCRAAAARRPSRLRWRHTSAQRQRSGFPRSARSGGTRCAVHGAGSRRDVAAAPGRRSRRREGLSVPIPSIRPGGAHPEPQWGLRATSRFIGQFFHLFRGRHAPARGSVGHFRIRT